MGYQCLSLECCDPDQLTDVVDQTSMRHRILPGGALRIKAEKLRLSSGTLQRGRYDMGVLVDGAWPQGQVTIGIVLEAPADIQVNGYICPPLSIQLYSEGSDLLYRAEPGTTWFAYNVDREYIQQSALQLYGRPLPIPESGSISIQPDLAASRRIVTTVQNLFATGGSPDSAATMNAVCASMEEQLHYELACALLGDHYKFKTGNAKHVAKRRQIMVDAEDYLHANITEPFSMKRFAAATDTSQRMLEYHFHRIYGVTPKTWIRSIKLNAAHQELKRSRGDTNKHISEIAMNWGFQHLGRFSIEYRRLFGERPKDTLGR